ncbi:hypothetical protein [Paenibacillus sonchi]|nr:hypothetical protein [Paenibacillus sonchi]
MSTSTGPFMIHPRNDPDMRAVDIGADQAIPLDLQVNQTTIR